MHSRDRHWRLVFWISMAALLLLCLPVATSAASLMSEIVHGRGVSWGAAVPDANMLLLPAIWLATLSQGGLFSGAPSRRREQLRARALAGDLGAMPVARLIGPRNQSQEPVALPLSVLRMTTNGTAGVIATADALVQKRAYKDEVAIRWIDARLFEVWRNETSSNGGYCLYGPGDTFIEWTEYPGNAPSPPKYISPAEMRRRQQLLPGVVMRLTGLRARTTVDALAETPAATRRISPMEVLIFLVGHGYLLAYTLVPGVLALTLPLTANMWLNLYASVTLFGAGAVFIAAEATTGLRRLRHRHDQPPVLQIPAHEGLAEETIEVRRRMRTWQRLLIGLAGLVFLGDGIPFIAAIWAGSQASGVWLVMTALGLAAFLGLLVTIASLVPHETTITAAPDALAQDTSKRLAWDNIGRLDARYKYGRLTKFVAVSNGLVTRTIEWAANPKDYVPPAVAQQPELPHLLAAVVAERTGLRWTVVPER